MKKMERARRTEIDRERGWKREGGEKGLETGKGEKGEVEREKERNNRGV